MKNHCNYKLMDTCTHSRMRALLAALLTMAWTGSGFADIQPYSARYSIYRNGKLTGKVEVKLEQQGDSFTIRSEGRGTHGLARILRARDNEQVTGRVRDGRFMPDQYTRHTRVAGIDDRWIAEFDWVSSQVNVIHDDDERFELAMTGEALDPLSLKLEMRRRLDDLEPDLRFLMVEEDELDAQNFRILRTEWLETSLGCLETTPVEKIRTNSKRYTRAWHAHELANIEVRVEHGKTDGNHLEMRITELILNDESVIPRPGCSARQTAKGTMP